MALGARSTGEQKPRFFFFFFAVRSSWHCRVLYTRPIMGHVEPAVQQQWHERTVVVPSLSFFHCGVSKPRLLWGMWIQQQQWHENASTQPFPFFHLSRVLRPTMGRADVVAVQPQQWHEKLPFGFRSSHVTPSLSAPGYSPYRPVSVDRHRPPTTFSCTAGHSPPPNAQQQGARIT